MIKNNLFVRYFLTSYITRLYGNLIRFLPLNPLIWAGVIANNTFSLDIQFICVFCLIRLQTRDKWCGNNSYIHFASFYIKETVHYHSCERTGQVYLRVILLHRLSHVCVPAFRNIHGPKDVKDANRYLLYNFSYILLHSY